MRIQPKPLQVLLVGIVRVLLKQQILQILSPSNMLLIVVAIVDGFFEDLPQPAMELLELGTAGLVFGMGVDDKHLH